MPFKGDVPKTQAFVRNYLGSEPGLTPLMIAVLLVGRQCCVSSSAMAR